MSATWQPMPTDEPAIKPLKLFLDEGNIDNRALYRAIEREQRQEMFSAHLARIEARFLEARP